MTMPARLTYRIATAAEHFEAIHRLNYRTFAIEIPQHPPNPEQRLVDRFHDQNTYVVCLAGERVVGMVAGRTTRPFSLDQKVPDLDRHLPAHCKALEVRLLAVEPAFRKTAVFYGLVRHLYQHFETRGYDLAVISGTVRQLRLYRHLGFTAFGPLVGTPDALYQPMYLRADVFNRVFPQPVQVSRPAGRSNFQPGPVTLSPEVMAAFREQPLPHREPRFTAMMGRVRSSLAGLVSAPCAEVLVGTGTLANDAIAAQLRFLPGRGLVLANGEFGERLVDQARRWQLDFAPIVLGWGEPIDWQRIEADGAQSRPGWIWAVLSETSTGMTNSLAKLRAVAEKFGADVAVDAVSAVGQFAVDLSGVRLASAVSGKGLAGPPGLAIVFHDGRLAPAGQIPIYLDLATYRAAGSVPFTHSSNLLQALDQSLAVTDWRQKFAGICRASCALRAGLRAVGLQPLTSDEHATPGVVTIPLPRDVSSTRVGMAMDRKGFRIAYQSGYLLSRNWIQICLMGNFDATAAARLPGTLAEAVWSTEPGMSAHAATSAHCGARPGSRQQVRTSQ